MNILFTQLAALAPCLNFAPSALAQGTVFNYQGRLSDSGQPANGIYDFRFAIYDDAGGGTAVGPTNTLAPVPVSNGVFSVDLDFGSAPFDGSARWLEIGVRTNGSTSLHVLLEPRQALTPVPYAITAGHVTGSVAAGQLIGLIATANIGAGMITSTMLAPGSVTSNQLTAGSVTTTSLADGAVSLGKLTIARAGSLSTTFSNPAPTGDDRFGHAVAAVGTDKILIGAYGHDTGAIGDVGAAYLFTTNGTLLTTFTNPAPAIDDRFGTAVAAVGIDKVLIGAYKDDAGATNAGSAYLFSINGTLLTAFTNPTPASDDLFGCSSSHRSPHSASSRLSPRPDSG